MFILTVPAHALEKYICIGDQAVGFRLLNGRWSNAVFNVNDDRLMVMEIPPKKSIFGDATINFVVRKFGSDRNLHECSRQTFDGKPTTRIVCGGLGFGFLMDTKSLRYQDFYGLGYLDGEDRPGNTPSLTIGKCTRVE